MSGLHQGIERAGWPLPGLLQRSCQLIKTLISLGFMPLSSQRLLICQHPPSGTAAAPATTGRALLLEQQQVLMKLLQATSGKGCSPMA